MCNQLTPILQHGIFFTIFPREIRNQIYSQLNIYPFSLGHESKGIYASCQQAQIEMHEETSLILNRFLNTCLDNFERVRRLPRPVIIDADHVSRKRNLEIVFYIDSQFLYTEVKALAPLATLYFDRISFHLEEKDKGVAIAQSHVHETAHRFLEDLHKYDTELFKLSRNRQLDGVFDHDFMSMFNVKELTVMWDFTFDANTTPAKKRERRDGLSNRVQQDVMTHTERFRFRKQLGCDEHGAVFVATVERWSSLDGGGIL